ncbi:alpha-amylase family glycosyl hydrolase [Chryseolinea sp. T2]|uniref:alpha-amylase family glycosyl hydrolase n=1 Tax=Chryseolinea sp. T2 TaxID=3129255 RepID=UPI003076DF8C
MQVIPHINNDGIGDLNGIRTRLDYLQELGVKTIWLSPIFTSPMADFGYDIMDYCNVDSCFGSLEGIIENLLSCLFLEIWLF